MGTKPHFTALLAERVDILVLVLKVKTSWEGAHWYFPGASTHSYVKTLKVRQKGWISTWEVFVLVAGLDFQTPGLLDSSNLPLSSSHVAEVPSSHVSVLTFGWPGMDTQGQRRLYLRMMYFSDLIFCVRWSDLLSSKGHRSSCQ